MSVPEPADLPNIPGYTLSRRLGHGGMGIVYQALRQYDQQWVALKMIIGTSPNLRHRFQREVNAVARLRHPHIVELFGTGVYGEWPYFTMELLTGGTLAANRGLYLDDMRRTVTLLEQLARAVHHAHELGIIHRDLKPGNVLLTEQGEPRICDFGLAKWLDDNDDSLTSTGAVLGTPAYMAPEVARGEFREAGPGVDTYALGVILYELLTGELPFRGRNRLQVMEQICSQSPPPPRRFRAEIPPQLERLCLFCMAKSPAARPASALELAEALNDVFKVPLSLPETEQYREGPGRLTAPRPDEEDSSADDPLDALGELSLGGSHNPNVNPHAIDVDLRNPSTGNRLDTLGDQTADDPPPNPNEEAHLTETDLNFGVELPTVPGFEVLDVAGRGGLAIVFRARQGRTRRVVAIKMLSRMDPNPDMVRRLRLEGDLLSRLQHPNIVQLFDVGEHERGPYLVEEFLPGGSLASRIESMRFSERDSVQLVATLARAMHYVHHFQGDLFVHRNLKPGCVMFTTTGTPKIINFGLVYAPSMGTDDFEPEGLIVGTPAYMPPEQARGDIAATDPSTDVYGLGGILYHLLTGQPPFQGDNGTDILRRVLGPDLPESPRLLNPEVSRRVEGVCVKALEKKASRRFATALEMAEELDRTQRG